MRDIGLEMAIRIFILAWTRFIFSYDLQALFRALTRSLLSEKMWMDNFSNDPQAIPQDPDENPSF